MSRKWSELKPGDRIFLMIPMAQRESSHLLYQPQVAELIQSREKVIPYDNSKIWMIKFKYTDVSGKRQPMTLTVAPDCNGRLVLCSSYKVLKRKMQYGEFICALDTVALARAYNNMVYDETRKIQQHIDSEYAAINKIANSYISSEIFNKL